MYIGFDTQRGVNPGNVSAFGFRGVTGLLWLRRSRALYEKLPQGSNNWQHRESPAMGQNETTADPTDATGIFLFDNPYACNPFQF